MNHINLLKLFNPYQTTSNLPSVLPKGQVGIHDMNNMNHINHMSHINQMNLLRQLLKPLHSSNNFPTPVNFQPTFWFLE